MCSCDDGDPPRVFESRLRKARPLGHPYECCECGNEILHGDWYEDVNGLWSDSWDSFATCLRCAARRNAWAAIECAPAFTRLGETIHECLTANDYDGKRMVRRIDHAAGRDYFVALRTARAALRSEVQKLEAVRAERYRQAGAKREALKRQRAHLGEGI